MAGSLARAGGYGVQEQKDGYFLHIGWWIDAFLTFVV
jgi:hypothetical protein